jgi:hypothetical protein
VLVLDVHRDLMDPAVHLARLRCRQRHGDRCAYGELLRYTDEARMAYVRVAISPTQSAVLVVRADMITPARAPMRASKIR